MLNKTLMASVAALAMAGAAVAQDSSTTNNSPSAAGNPAPPSAAQKAPGQMKEGGTSAREVAPGQVKRDGTSARDEAPGRNKEVQEKTHDEASDKARHAREERSTSDRHARDREDGRDGEKAGKPGKGSLTGVSPEQKSKVREAFGKHKVAPVRSLDVNVAVGVVVPRTVKFYPVPRDILVIAPAYEGFLYFVVDDRICIVDPETYEIVEIIVVA